MYVRYTKGYVTFTHLGMFRVLTWVCYVYSPGYVTVYSPGYVTCTHLGMLRVLTWVCYVYSGLMGMLGITRGMLGIAGVRGTVLSTVCYMKPAVC